MFEENNYIREKYDRTYNSDRKSAIKHIHVASMLLLKCNYYYIAIIKKKTDKKLDKNNDKYENDK